MTIRHTLADASRRKPQNEEDLDGAEPKLTPLLFGRLTACWRTREQRRADDGMRVRSMEGRIESTASDDGSSPPRLRKNVSFGDLSITRIPSSSDLTETEKKAAFFQRSDYRSFGVAESKLRRKLGISMQGIPSKAEEKRVVDHLCSEEEQARCLVS
mmetsp:Transcript_7339/g.23093  ORF Transcript_7339/g.23093 Transcript_7339/m.23093 type:complete len:157 (+) Transcript_7339:95-565(+)